MLVKNNIPKKSQKLSESMIIILLMYLTFIFGNNLSAQAAENNDIGQLSSIDVNGVINNSISEKTNNLLPRSIDSIYKSGINGTASWDIDDNGLLTIHSGTLAYGTGNWSPYASSIKSVYVEEGVFVNSATLDDGGRNSVFSDLPNVITIDVTNLDVSNANHLGAMFQKDPKLKQIIGIETWDTSKCVWMSSMFYNDNDLQKLDLSNFETSKVESMGSMFMNCTSLEELDLSNFDMSRLQHMVSMFNGVPGKIIGLKDFDTSRITDLTGVFAKTDFTKNDPSDIANWDVSKVTNMNKLFEGTKFEELDLSNWDTGNVTDMSYLFEGDSNINQIKGLSGWNTSNVVDFTCTFQNVTDTDISVINNWDISNANSFTAMFSGCKNLERLNLSNFKENKAEKFGRMFYNDRLLNENTLIGYESLVKSNAKLINGMYQGTDFEVIDLSQYDTSNVTNFADLFRSTKSLKKIIGNFDTSSATDLSGMFASSGIENFEELNIDEWDISSVTNLSNIFSISKVLNFDFLKNWNTSSVTNLSGAFQNTIAKDISGIKDWDVSQVTKFQDTFQKNYFETLPIENWDVSSATNMSELFFYSYALKHLDLSKWHTSKVTNFYTIFNTMQNLETLDISGFDTTHATNLNYFFGGNNNLWKITLGPKVLMQEEVGSSKGTNFPIPKPGTSIGDSSYKAISNMWQEVDEKSGGSDHQPVGELLSNDEIVKKYSTTGNPVTTYVWQQQLKNDFSIKVPDIDFGTINNGSQIVQRKNKGFAIEIDNNNYPIENIQSNLTISLAKPLTSSNGLNTMNNVLIYREKGKSDQILSDNPIQIYVGNFPSGISSIEWDEKDGVLLNMKNEPHAVSGSYSSVLNWTITNSL
ncbi:hypothetical protein C5L30_002393 [Companilactobacillus farciminis]|uniref:WxL domain-containing protein n=1 Tax=Companilactobacillus farciminis TaxID=1612 RepID=A0A4R5NE14_9LACO|nr:BspA family leucine-rich repeat surface protein [Companilactobacillus farciminis]ATO45893.1 hypothetical protein LF20184_03575 [Companilactobacillus farciminis KCTC 3681 = DSM 20184]KRK62201.1 hypothetical protein FC68_GL002229 [Companilactobacillus farciminis KCTC 3681 = DSM 20184]TDG71813.1 hypothetical protein C5L30_002393 [Companilactobacillus farciminis]